VNPAAGLCLRPLGRLTPVLIAGRPNTFNRYGGPTDEIGDGRTAGDGLKPEFPERFQAFGAL